MTDVPLETGGSDQCAPAGALGPVLDRLLDSAKSENVTMRELLEAFGQRSFVPALLVPALIVLSPLSGIPFLPTIFGTMIFLVAIQMAIGRHHLWLPGLILDRTIRGDRLAGAIRYLRPSARWFDRHSGRRLAFLTSRPAAKILELVAAIAGITMPFLELVPFSSSLLALAVCLICLAMLSRDGLWAAVAVLPIAGALALIVAIWL
ncbi:exopolysaccharide biosynthesis protein [Rhodobacterales bacterium HKCCE2091]|nr:exopolysaccharide biosynthesis protein [Rhodobacterales bacterium HKCCE2091]